MREIKFRLWGGRKKWVKDPWVMTKNGKLLWCKDLTEVDMKTHILEQFTGLKDQNGVDIYYGDIVKLKCGREGLVFWHNTKCAFLVSLDTANYIEPNDEWSESEVIGNVHQGVKKK